jgi:hypothetical protein
LPSGERNVSPGLSNDPADKLAAYLNYRTSKGSSEHQRHPLYYDARREWYEGLPEDWQDYLTYVLDAWSNWGEAMPQSSRSLCPERLALLWQILGEGAFWGFPK